MSNSEKVLSVINHFLETNVSSYKVGNKTFEFHPLEEFWKKGVLLFLASTVFYVIENAESDEDKSYYSVLKIVRTATHMKRDDLNRFFGSGKNEKSSDAYNYYEQFLVSAQKCVVSLVLIAEAQLLRAAFNKERQALLEEVFKSENGENDGEKVYFGRPK